MEFICENVREVSCKGDYDVVIAGAGPSGCAAAWESARAGMRVLLIEKNGCCGGMWTAGLLGFMIDHQNKHSEFMERLRSELESLGEGYCLKYSTDFRFSPEAMKYVLEDLLTKCEVRIRYYTQVVAVAVSDKKITHVITESKSGREAWSGKIFIDCTGDGDLAFYSGCSYEYGSPDNDSITQPMSLMAEIVDPMDRLSHKDIGGESRDVGISELKKDIQKTGKNTSYLQASLFPAIRKLRTLMVTHFWGSGINADELTEGTIEGRKEIFELVKALRQLGGDWKDVLLSGTGSVLGVRESRRIKTLYRVTQQDAIDGRRHEDAVCTATFCFDMHALSREGNDGIESIALTPIKPYDIPMRSLISADMENLLIAGRCICGDIVAHSSYRVTGNAVPLGQAAGVLSAVSVKKGLIPAEVPFFELKSFDIYKNTENGGFQK